MLQLVERGFFKPIPIKLSDKTQGMPTSVNPDVQVLRVGKFNHPKYGEFEITSATLMEMKANFDANVRGIDIAFDYFHDSDKEASGWPTELYLSDDDTELWAKVDWTKAARQKLAEREVRYFSPDFAFQWDDPETGVSYNNVLFGGGLTNRPFVKDMAAIVAAENNSKGVIMNEKELKELQAKVLKLAEDVEKGKADNAALKKGLEEKLAEITAADVPPPAPAADPDADAADDANEDEKSLADQLAECKKQLAEMTKSNEKLMAEKAAADKAKTLAEKETAFNILLTEGKACVAQKDAFLKNDMTAFIKLAQKVNLDGSGHAGGAGVESDDRDERVLKLAEEKCKADASLSRVDAISLANSEIK